MVTAKRSSTVAKRVTKSPAKETVAKSSAKKSGPSLSKRYAALRNEQRDENGLVFYVFHVPASEIYQWGLIDRMTPENQRGIQRRLNKTKVTKIKEFLQDPSNTIATSVVVVFKDAAISFAAARGVPGAGTVTVEWAPRRPAAVIVDGQHRVEGAHAFFKEHGKDIHLNVVGIAGADDTEGAFQFLVINNNSSKVSTSQVKALFASYQEEALLRRMLDSGSTNVDEEKITALDVFDRGVDSPFRGQLKWQKNQDGFIVPNALEAGLGEVQNRTALLGVDSDAAVDLFSAIWTTIKLAWGHLWKEETHLLEKAVVQTLTAFVCEALSNVRVYSGADVDYMDPDVVDDRVKSVLSKLEPAFFEVQWAKTGLDTRAGQEMLISDLRMMASNSTSNLPWHTGLQAISIAAVGDGGVTTKKKDRPRNLR